MTNAELERLAILAEEAGEVQQIIGKIIRHGYDSYNPFDESKVSNRQLLEKELADLIFAIRFLTETADVNEDRINTLYVAKYFAIQKYLHYNELPKTIVDQ